VAGASAPFVGAFLAQLLDSYAHAFLALAAVSGLAAVLVAWPNRKRPNRVALSTSTGDPTTRGAHHG
jgi:poly(3-hydroxybutyrate) depolymerase